MTERQWGHNRGFSTLELFIVIGVILILVGVTSLSAVNMINEARRASALAQISAVFRAARQAAQTKNEERRVVLEVTYDADAQDQLEAYELDPVLRYWVERKTLRTKDWDEEGLDRYASPPLDDVQSLPPGVMLVDINGRGLIPSDVNKGEENPDGTRSFKSFVVFNSRGVVTHYYRRDDPLAKDLDRYQSNLALHLMFDTTQIDLTLGKAPGRVIEYLDVLEDGGRVSAPPVAEQLEPYNKIGDIEDDDDHTYRARTQSHTLYLLRLTGQTNEYDYGIYPPWPNSVLPDSAEEAI